MKLAFQESGIIDLTIGQTGLKSDNTLATAVIISLLTDKRADPDDRLPADLNASSLMPPDRKGWCGDALSESNQDRIGSHLWLLNREKQTEETRRRAQEYAREALQWLVDDGYANSIDIEAFWAKAGRLEMNVKIILTDGSQQQIYIPGALYDI